MAEAKKAAKKAVVKKVAKKPAVKKAAKKAAVKKAVAKKAAAKKPAAKKTTAKKVAAKKPAAKKATAKKTVVKAAAKKPASKKTASKAPAKKAAKSAAKTVAKKAAKTASKSTAKTATAKTSATKTAAAKKSATSAAGRAGSAKMTVRHYCQGIGDCHLLSFPKDDGGTYWILIDCGVHTSVTGGPAYIQRVVDDIFAQTQHLDAVVVTHEHMDHTSGFLSAKEAFGKFSVGEVWLAWTENGKDAQAKKLDKFKGQALSALQMASNHLAAAPALSTHLGEVAGGVDALLGFSFGIKGEKVRSTREAAEALATDAVIYREPTDPPIEIPGVSGMRIYVLAPSRDEKYIGITDRAGEMYAMGESLGWSISHALVNAFEPVDDAAAPFDPNEGTDLAQLEAAGTAGAAGATSASRDIAEFAQAHYYGPAGGDGMLMRVRSRQLKNPRPDANLADQSWRRIDNDWLGVSADLAMQLDDRTNNTSLVLAFEFVETGRVALFAADAQIGNWMSWQDTKWKVGGKQVTGPDLLARTVYYKVGHHGSQNATASVKGLDLMTDGDLSAFIPTNEADAKKVKWGSMPFKGIITPLTKQASGRVVRADDTWLKPGGNGKAPFAPSGSIQAIRSQPGLWVEFDLA